MPNQSKILDYGKRYDFGETYGIPALLGHEFAAVDHGIRGIRLNYYPPAGSVALTDDGESVQCSCSPTVISISRTEV